MDDKLTEPELCGLTSADQSAAIAECIDGLGCCVYAGGKELLKPWASQKVEELVGIFLRDNAFITTNSAPQYFVLKFDDSSDEFTVLRGPLTADAFRQKPF
jgi:hypothetical protein